IESHAAGTSAPHLGPVRRARVGLAAPRPRGRERGGARMSASLRPVLQALTRQRGVRASLIVSEKDGLVIDSSLRFGQDGERVAALAASVYRKARLSAKAARLGAVTFLQLDAERGRICVAGGGAGLGTDLVIVTVADPTANVGLIRMELFRALELIA